jgi:hypothetical protein
MKHARLLRRRFSGLSCWAALLGAVSVASSIAAANTATKAAPEAQTLFQADKNSDDWLLPARHRLEPASSDAHRR